MRTNRHLAIPGVLGAVMLIVAACGGDDGGGETAAAGPASDDTVSVADVDGQSVLVNADGAALYVSDEEQAADDVLCVSEGCVAFWEPLTIDGEKPTGDVGDGELGTLHRPDGGHQVTLDGRPLYTFADDSSGEINGDGLSDTFDGQTLTWRVVTADGSAGGSSGDDDQDDGGGFDY